MQKKDESAIDRWAEENGIESEKWALIKEILKPFGLPPKDFSPNVIDDRPKQKKITDFLAK